MLKPATPSNEPARLAALRRYHLLDTDPEQGFDDLTYLASMIFGTQIALVSLVDEKRQWFKSRHGIDALETSREISFCGHAILQDKPFVVEDAAIDRRFLDNPLVTGDPYIRFYAGAPLVDGEGYALGTLCVIDREPRKISQVQATALSALARQAIYLIETRITLTQLADALGTVKELKSLLPICAWCRNMREEDGAWVRFEEYVHNHTGSNFTHGICPSCLEKQKAQFGR